MEEVENSTIISGTQLQGFSTRLFIVTLRSRKKDEGFLQGEGCLDRSFSSFHSLEKAICMYSLQ